MRFRSIARGISNVGGKVLTGGALTTLIFLWAMTAYAFSTYFDFTGSHSIFIEHTFVDLWGVERSVYTLDIWGGFAPMIRNLSLTFNLFLDIPNVPNLGKWFVFDSGDVVQTLLSVLNVLGLGFPMVMRIILYIVEILIWMVKVTTIAPLCFLFSLAGGVMDGGQEVGQFGTQLLSWFNFSLSEYLNEIGL